MVINFLNLKRKKRSRNASDLVCQRGFPNILTSICTVADVGLQLEFGQSETKMLKLHHSSDTIMSYCNFILCSASNRTIRPGFGMHHRPYGCVVRIQPIDYVHRSSNYFQNIYYHIYPFQPIYQFSIHQTWNMYKIAISVFMDSLLCDIT